MRNKIYFSACLIIVCLLTISQFQLSISVNHKNQFRVSNKQDEDDYFLSHQIAFFKISSLILLHDTFPCRVINVTKEPIQDDGTFKVNIQGEDIFTYRIYNQTFSSTDQGKEVIVARKEYQLISITDDVLSLMDHNGNLRTDLPFPDSGDRDQSIVDCMVDNFQNDKQVYVVVLAAMGKEKISFCKTEQ